MTPDTPVRLLRGVGDARAKLFEKLNAKGYYTAVCIDDDACIACAMCAMMCPDCAITIIPDGGEK